MKKVVKCMCMVAVMALVFTSCKKDEKAVVFQGETQQLVVEDEDAAKVYVNNSGYVTFEQNDMVTLYNVSSWGSTCATYRASSTGTSTSFMPYGGEINGTTDGAFYAFYPGGADNITPNLSNGNRCTFRVADTQEYRTVSGGLAIPHDALYMAGKTTETNLSSAYMQFHNICGVLSMKFYSPTGKTIKKIRVTDKHFNITGDMQLIITEIDPEELTSLFNAYDENNDTYMATLNAYRERIGYNVTNASNAITLDLGEGVALGTTKNTANKFFMVLRPLALSNGYIIEVSEDGTTWTTVVDSNKNNCIHPNVFKNFSAVNVG
jgi:hypothetical protein